MTDWTTAHLPDLASVRQFAAHWSGDIHVLVSNAGIMVPPVGLRKPKQPVRGRDVAGVVEAVGRGVMRFRPNDAVFVGQTLTTGMLARSTETLDELRELIESGAVTPAIERTYPLSETADARRHFAEAHARAKNAITVSAAE